MLSVCALCFSFVEALEVLKRFEKFVASYCRVYRAY